MIFADIETDGLLDSMTKIHCIVLKDDERVLAFHDDEAIAPRAGSVEEGVAYLVQNSRRGVVFHNAYGFDVPAITKLYPLFDRACDGSVMDSLLAARAVVPDPSHIDYRISDYPKELVGRHSLKAWGRRLGVLKDEIETDWAQFTQEMLDYCIKDVEVLAALWAALKQDYGLDIGIYQRELAFMQAIGRMNRNGFAFDEKAAAQLYARLSSQREELNAKVQDAFPAQRVSKYKRRPKKLDLALHEEDENGDVWKMRPFNPQSRAQIAEGFMRKYGWKPMLFTPAGQPLMDEAVLSKMDYPEAKAFSERMRVSKMIGMLAEGEQSWMKLVKDGRIHADVSHNGTRTHRCTHRRPNLGQVDRDPEMRALFIARPGTVLLGCDLSGLELRCLAHYMADKKYTEVLLDGDIHTHNMVAWGVKDRSLGKRLTYACLYGGGDALLGDILGGDQRAGTAARKRFLKNLPALDKLIKNAKTVAKKRGWLKSLDGRPTFTPEHAALNSLLQSAGAILAKEWVTRVDRLLDRYNARIVAMVHDEVQIECCPENAEEIGSLVVEAAASAGRSLKLSLPMAAEYSIGQNWAETH